MQLASAKNFQLRPSWEKPKKKPRPVMVESIMEHAFCPNDILTLKAMVLSLREKLEQSRINKKDTPTMSREEEQWVFCIRKSALEEIRGLKAELVDAVNGDVGILNGKISEKERVVGLVDEAVVLANQGMVYKIAYQVLAKKANATRIGLEDLVCVGNEAILKKAIGKFRPELGNRFMTYAKAWVKRFMTDEANKWIADVKSSRLLDYETTRAIAFTNNHMTKHGKDPTDAQIAKGANIKLSRVKKYELRKVAKASIDADEKKGKKNEARPDIQQAKSIEEDSLAKSVVRQVLSKLPMRYAQHAKVLEIRFGLDIGYERTYEEAGAVIGISKQRVEQKEKKAMGILAELLKRRDIDSFF
jgi:RNA polymerase sigma factor (sigma-70 family)